MSLFNHIIGFRSKDSNKMTVATLYYITGGVFSSVFEGKWFVFCVLIALFPAIVFSLKDFFVERCHKSVVKILVCSIIMAFSVYILPEREKVTNEIVMQPESSKNWQTEFPEEEKVEEKTPVETEVIETEIQRAENEENIVYRGKTGNKYHKSNCGTLKGKGTPISYEEAVKDGREACKICKP